MYYICNLNTLGVEFLNDRGFTVWFNRPERAKQIGSKRKWNEAFEIYICHYELNIFPTLNPTLVVYLICVPSMHILIKSSALLISLHHLEIPK